MSEFEKRLLSALEEAAKNPDGVKKHEFTHVRLIRNKLKMSVPEFSKTFNLPQRSVERWDVTDKPLTGAVTTLLKVIEKNPKAVMEALQE